MLMRILEPKDHFMLCKELHMPVGRRCTAVSCKSPQLHMRPAFADCCPFVQKMPCRTPAILQKKYPAYCRAYGYLHISLFKIRDFHDYFMSALSLRFSKDIVDVTFHGILGYRKLSCYLRIAESSVQKEQHFPFSSGELIPV